MYRKYIFVLVGVEQKDHLTQSIHPGHMTASTCINCYSSDRTSERISMCHSTAEPLVSMCSFCTEPFHISKASFVFRRRDTSVEPLVLHLH